MAAVEVQATEANFTPISALPNKGFSQYSGENYVNLNREACKKTWEQAYEDRKEIRGGNQYALMLAKILQYGEQGTDKNVAKAASIHESVITDGYLFVSSHMRELARILLVGGDGTSQDIPRAKQLLEDSISNSGNNFSRTDLSYLIRHNAPEEVNQAKELLSTAVTYEQDDSFYPLAYLAYLLDIGTPGFDKIDDVTKDLLMKKAESKANNYVKKYFGHLVQDGRANLNNEFVWKAEVLEKLASRQSFLLNFSLAYCFEHGGKTLPKNYDTALMLYETAQKGGHKDAAERIAHVRQVKKEEAERKEQLDAERQERIAARDAVRRAAEKALLAGGASGSSNASQEASDNSSNDGSM